MDACNKIKNLDPGKLSAQNCLDLFGFLDFTGNRKTLREANLAQEFPVLFAYRIRQTQQGWKHEVGQDGKKGGENRKEKLSANATCRCVKTAGVGMAWGQNRS